MSSENDLELLKIKEHRLHQLKKQQASFGLHTPVHISTEIEDTEAEIKQLRKSLGMPEATPESAPEDVSVSSESTPPEKVQKPQSSSTSGSKWWIPIVVALIGVAGTIFTVVWTRGDGEEPPIEPPGGEFTYQVRVQTVDTGEPIPNAIVTIEVGGKAPLDAVTDSKGIARIFIDASYAEKPGFLIVERDGFHSHNQNIDLVVDALPDVVLLEP
jgi:hypothetical protein